MQSISIVIWRCLVSVCLLLFVLTEGHSILRHMVESLDPELTESVGVELSAEYKRNSRYRREGISSDHSDELNVDLRIADQPIHLVLRHNPNANTDLPVYVMRSGKAVQEDVPSLRVTRMYQDIAHEGSFAVTEPVGDSSGYMLEGLFTVDNDLYLITPNTDGGRVKRLERGYSHNVHKLERTVNILTDPILDDDVVARATSGRPIKRETKINYEVELYMVTDSAIYDFWYDKQQGSSPKEKGLLTLDAIKQYFAFLINTVDLRFKNIKEKDFSITILASGLLIMEQPEDSPWTDSIVVKTSGERGTVDASKALASFKAWVNGREDLSKVDHVMLFSGYGFLYGGKPISGLANVGGVCGTSKSSIVENSFKFVSVTAAAHELGHNLGAAHDGKNNKCSSDDLYIMAHAPNYAVNQWNWSPCSIDYFRTKLESLNQGDNCLIHKSDKSHKTESSPLPGQVYSMDQQCAYSFGEGSTFCRFLYNETNPISSVCTEIFCSKPGKVSKIYNCLKFIPAEGSSCGDKQWCRNGRCVEDTKAPALDPLCPFGDTPGIPSGMSRTCQEMIQTNPHLCYTYYFKACCVSCPSIRTSDKSCEYGDRSICTINRGGCYTKSTLNKCCGTCKQFETGIKGCEYGDKLTGCKGQVNKSRCALQYVIDSCCGSCHSLGTK